MKPKSWAQVLAAAAGVVTALSGAGRTGPGRRHTRTAAGARSSVPPVIVMLAVPFSVVGAVWLMWLLGYNVSIAAWVGMIALMGLDAETGVFMLLFLDLSYERRKAK